MLKKIWLAPIRFYQKLISPILPPRCRYYPTCSTYALTAIERHGIIKGTIMGTSRILRCHPFVKGGLDYVPSTFSLRRNPCEECHHDH